MQDSKYTELWTDNNFTESRVQKYDSKFFRLWEKHVKHCEQVAAVRSMLTKPGLWVDCPIGSGRLFDAIEWDDKLGLDIAYGTKISKTAEKLRSSGKYKS